MAKRKIKAVVDIKPTGNQVLVEMLTPQETLETKLILTGNKETDTPQGYILAMGNTVPESYGVKIGDRVFFSSPYAILPPGQSVGSDERKKWCIDYTSIKGVLLEGKE